MPIQEDFFNLALGKVLGERNDGWIEDAGQILTEQRGTIEGHKSLKPDILIAAPFKPPVVIECEYSKHPERDAEARLGLEVATHLGGGKIHHAVAVQIPEEFRQLNDEQAKRTLEKGAAIGYAMLHRTPDGVRRFPAAGFLHGTATDLARMAGAMAPGTRTVERTVAEIKGAIEQNIRKMDSRLNQGAQEKITGRLMQWSRVSGLSAANILWLDALLTQQQLARYRVHGIDGEPIRGMPASTESGWTVEGQIREWRRILDKNWEAIFAPAVDALEHMSESDWECAHHVLAELVKVTKEIALAQIGRELSVGAELFPKVTEGRKHTAAFYTRVAVADLLATLTIRREDAPWRERGVRGRHQAQDLACGTGTLLRAAYRRAEALHREAGGTRESTREFHRTAMEEGLYGCDINPIATHMTSSTLAVAGGGWDYGETKIAWAPVGGTYEKRTGRRPRLGGLGYLRGAQSPGQLKLIDEAAEDTKESSGRTAERQGQVYQYDLPGEGAQWTLMNPPYSRTHGAGTRRGSDATSPRKAYRTRTTERGKGRSRFPASARRRPPHARRSGGSG